MYDAIPLAVALLCFAYVIYALGQRLLSILDKFLSRPDFFRANSTIQKEPCTQQTASHFSAPKNISTSVSAAQAALDGSIPKIKSVKSAGGFGSKLDKPNVS